MNVLGWDGLGCWPLHYREYIAQKSTHHLRLHTEYVQRLRLPPSGHWPVAQRSHWGQCRPQYFPSLRLLMTVQNQRKIKRFIHLGLSIGVNGIELTNWGFENAVEEWLTPDVLWWAKAERFMLQSVGCRGKSSSRQNNIGCDTMNGRINDAFDAFLFP